MYNFYDIDLIPIILKRFKVKKIVISELLDKKILSEISTYSKNNDASYVSICSDKDIKADFNDYTLNVLPNINDYDAIFLNDDPNWYTVYNELKIIKQNCAEFPLVFICNNIFPHKRRDSYKNPDIIPKEFQNKYSRKLLLHDNIKILDDFYHAIDENTSKNGVLTAIEDFLAENASIGVMDINFLNGITILYPENSISQIRLNALSEEMDNFLVDNGAISDNIVENQLLSNYISGFNISEDNLDLLDEFKSELDEKEKIILDFEDKVKFHDDELSYKDTQIMDVNSKLSLKDTQIKNFESKLVNSEAEIENLNNEITSLESEFKQKNQSFINKEIKFQDKISLANFEIDNLKNDVHIQQKKEAKLNKQLKLKEKELSDEKNTLKMIKQQYTSQLSRLENKEYCITCFKEEINNNHLEIQYLKNVPLIKKILNPFAYVFILLKSNPKDLSLNFKLYRALKNSKCFDIGYYLNNYEDVQESKWCKYFSPELHYVCMGFNEKRKFNKKYFNRDSREDLLNYILNCDN